MMYKKSFVVWEQY